MHLILRKKHIFNVTEYTKDDKWLYFKGTCNYLLGDRVTTICLENKKSNYKRIKLIAGTNETRKNTKH